MEGEASIFEENSHNEESRAAVEIQQNLEEIVAENPASVGAPQEPAAIGEEPGQENQAEKPPAEPTKPIYIQDSPLIFRLDSCEGQFRDHLVQKRLPGITRPFPRKYIPRKPLKPSNVEHERRLRLHSVFPELIDAIPLTIRQLYCMRKPFFELPLDVATPFMPRKPVPDGSSSEEEDEEEYGQDYEVEYVQDWRIEVVNFTDDQPRWVYKYNIKWKGYTRLQWVKEDRISYLTYREHWLRVLDLLQGPLDTYFLRYPIPPTRQHWEFDERAFMIQLGHVDAFNMMPPSKAVREEYQDHPKLANDLSCDAKRPRQRFPHHCTKAIEIRLPDPSDPSSDDNDNPDDSDYGGKGEPKHVKPRHYTTKKKTKGEKKGSDKGGEKGNKKDSKDGGKKGDKKGKGGKKVGKKGVQSGTKRPKLQINPVALPVRSSPRFLCHTTVESLVTLDEPPVVEAANPAPEPPAQVVVNVPPTREQRREIMRQRAESRLAASSVAAVMPSVVVEAVTESVALLDIGQPVDLAETPEVASPPPAQDEEPVASCSYSARHNEPVASCSSSSNQQYDDLFHKRWFICEKCGKQVKHGKRNEHIKRYCPVTCPRCSKKFTLHTFQDKHQRKCKEYKCELKHFKGKNCTGKFPDLPSYTAHIRANSIICDCGAHYRGKDAKKHICPVAGKKEPAVSPVPSEKESSESEEDSN